MPEKLTVELDDNILKRIDLMIDGSKIKSRSQAVEHLISGVINRENVKKAFILAGGKGSRMRPFTYEVPKPLIQVQGKPLLQHILDLLRKYDVRDVILSTGYMGDKIREYFGNGSRFGVQISYVEETESLGTAGPLNLARDLLDETFLMFNGDILANIDLHDFINSHAKNDGIATLTLKPVRDPSRFGVAELRGDRILRFIEKPESSVKSRLINAGVYILEPEVIDYVPKGKAMMETDVFPKLAEEGRLYGYPFDGQWFDTGTYEAYEKAIKGWKGVD
ncbi:MAG: sugar phosphate nucleotidyltransferase [Candidatus Altiarchaeota archaeon]|nr:sugar phosphate nucleotidyltransferase [Candidatus Altiarchaeota archaeon]